MEYTYKNYRVWIVSRWLIFVNSVDTIYATAYSLFRVAIVVVERHQYDVFPLQAFARMIGVQLHAIGVAAAHGFHRINISDAAAISVCKCFIFVVTISISVLKHKFKNCFQTK